MREYTKEDLVQFMRWNTNAPMSIIRKASVEEIESFLKSKGVFDKFLETLDYYREFRKLETASKKFDKELRKLGVR